MSEILRGRGGRGWGCLPDRKERQNKEAAADDGSEGSRRRGRDRTSAELAISLSASSPAPQPVTREAKGGGFGGFGLLFAFRTL